MVIRVTIDGTKHRGVIPEHESPVVEVGISCPKCHKGPTMFARGIRSRWVGEVLTAEALAVCCKVEVGKIEVTMSSIFGREEDEEVVRQVQRAGGKVYG